MKEIGVYFFSLENELGLMQHMPSSPRKSRMRKNGAHSRAASQGDENQPPKLLQPSRTVAPDGSTQIDPARLALATVYRSQEAI